MAELAVFEPAHLDGALALSKAVNWPHRREDWALVADVAHGVVALDGGDVVGTAFCAPFGDIATLNMIVVADTHRGQGLGRQLMEAIMARAGERGMSLIATTDGLPLYRKLGFVETGRIVQYQGLVGEAAAPAREVRKGGARDLAQVVALDLVATGMDRRALLKRIVADGQLFLCEGGFACRRDFGRGQVIGPIVAPNVDAARDLLDAAASGLSGRFVRVDTLRGSGLEPALVALGLEHVGDGIEMLMAPAPARPGNQQRFALVSQALG